MKRLLLVLLCLTLVISLAAGCNKKDGGDSKGDSSQSAPESEIDWSKVVLKQLEEPQQGDTIAVLHTSMGDITVRLFPEEAPLAVENFTTHARDGYYDGVIFHQVMYEFMIQSGDPFTADPTVDESNYGYGGDSIWGGGFEDEFSANLYNFRGALSMVNTLSPNSNGSQFLIVQATSVDETLLADMLEPDVWWFNGEVTQKYSELGGVPWLDRHNTVFGHVIDGMDIVDQIAILPVKDSENSNADLRNYTPLDRVVIESIEITTY